MESSFSRFSISAPQCVKKKLVRRKRKCREKSAISLTTFCEKHQKTTIFDISFVGRAPHISTEVRKKFVRRKRKKTPQKGPKFAFSAFSGAYTQNRCALNATFFFLKNLAKTFSPHVRGFGHRYAVKYLDWKARNSPAGFTHYGARILCLRKSEKKKSLFSFCRKNFYVSEKKRRP